nr:hypothetical protein LTR18_002691 [Exophiala xenobiotica]
MPVVIDARAHHLTWTTVMAGTSELFGQSGAEVQDELTTFGPTTPYATSKAFAHWTAVNYREKYGMFVVNGILFNHESPRRGPSFRTYKLTEGMAQTHAGLIPAALVGNPLTKRDWGHVRDFVRGMWMSLQVESPDDYVFATGVTHTIKDFVECGFRTVGRVIEWSGEGEQQVAVDKKTGEVVVRIDPIEFKQQSHHTRGDPSKAERLLGWKREFTFEVCLLVLDFESFACSGVRTVKGHWR